jgi:malate synthase
MGGMSAQIPIKDDPKANEVAMEKVRADKLREVTAGHDGTWIAHPLINQIARKVFDEKMLGPNQVRIYGIFVLVTISDTLIVVLYPTRGCESCCRRPVEQQCSRKDHRGGHPR